MYHRVRWDVRPEIYKRLFKLLIKGQPGSYGLLLINRHVTCDRVACPIPFAVNFILMAPAAKRDQCFVPLTQCTVSDTAQKPSLQ